MWAQFLKMRLGSLLHRFHPDVVKPGHAGGIISEKHDLEIADIRPVLGRVKYTRELLPHSLARAIDGAFIHAFLLSIHIRIGAKPKLRLGSLLRHIVERDAIGL